VDAAGDGEVVSPLWASAGMAWKKLAIIEILAVLLSKERLVDNMIIPSPFCFRTLFTVLWSLFRRTQLSLVTPIYAFS
jgi:hypothetical protein